jgi:hypothetical protein
MLRDTSRMKNSPLNARDCSPASPAKAGFSALSRNNKQPTTPSYGYKTDGDEVSSVEGDLQDYVRIGKAVADCKACLLTPKGKGKAFTKRRLQKVFLGLTLRIDLTSFSHLK